MITTKFYETMKDLAKIVKIERIQNRLLFNKYTFWKDDLIKTKNCQDKEIFAFHGTSKNQPDLIFKGKEEVRL